MDALSAKWDNRFHSSDPEYNGQVHPSTRHNGAGAPSDDPGSDQTFISSDIEHVGLSFRDNTM